jgi:hypothetical protein
MSTPNEFSTAFSTAFDETGVPGRVCYPDDTDWGCTFTTDEISDMLEKPEVVLMMERAEALAWSTIATLSAWQISTCPITVRPCTARCADAGIWQSSSVGGSTGTLGSGSVAGFNPHINESGIWVNSCGHTQNGCSCTSLCEAILPGPVGAIEKVLVDGIVLPKSAYRVDNTNRLVRTDGGCWPTCQDFASSGTAYGFFVTYWRGVAPNAMTRYAAGVLAGEFLKACLGNECRLPTGVTSVTRQGMSFMIAGGLFESGKTGIREVDAVIGIYNPYALTAPPVVTSPDARPARMTTWG